MKAIAVPYIIAILLGVAVIGLVGYWMFSSGGEFGVQSSLQECRGKALLWCEDAKRNDWFTAAGFGDNTFGDVEYPECKEFTVRVGLDSVPNAKATCGVA